MDDYDFNSKIRTVATRFRPPQRTSRSLSHVCSRKGQRLGQPLRDSFHRANRTPSYAHAHLGKKVETLPATARDWRFVGPGTVGNNRAQQLTTPARHQLLQPVPSNSQISN
jgi:hypothetical protein